jgi:microcystin-dependent protein
MTQPFIGEIRMFGGSFAPLNWAFCNGQSMSIAEFSALFNLIGTTYGGDGQSTFNLPNLQSRLAVGVGQGQGLSNYTIGQVGGSETVTLTTAQMGSHSHSLSASKNTVTTNLPSGNLTGAGITSPAAADFYVNAPTTQTGNLNNATVTNTGNNLPHPNLMPSLCVSFIIALYGIYPSQS